MRCNEMQQMQAHDFRSRLECRPLRSGGIFQQITPEFVYQFQTQRDVAQHFGGEIVGHGEAGLHIRILPELAAVVKQDSRDHQIPVQLRIQTRQRHRAAHHLRHMLHQAATAGMVVFACCAGAAEALAVALKKDQAQLQETRVAHGVHEGGDVCVVGLLTRGEIGISEQQRAGFVFGERAHLHLPWFETVFALHPLSGELEESIAPQLGGILEQRIVVEDTPDECIGSIDELHLKERTARAGGLFDA